MEELAEGHVLAGRYRLGPAVGHGAMGQVHLAEDLRLARPVAVKSLRPELARYPDVRQRFGQEARAAARISHPNVVRVYDSGEEGRIPYLVMECLPGSTLVDELAWGPLELRRARRVGLDVLGALDAAHRLGIVHRDVKPGNILLSADLDGPVKVSDFGIAKSADDHSLTDSGGLVGTAAYLAPERVAGEPAAPASDIYGLGVVLYEAVAGRRPYEGETSLAVALAIHMGGAPGLLELRPDLDPALADVVERALARDPSERWASAAEMAEALRAWRPTASGWGPGATGATGATLVAAGAPVGAPTVALPAPLAALAAADTLVDPGAGAAAATVDDTLVDPGSLPPAADDRLGGRGGMTAVTTSVPAGAVAPTSTTPVGGRAARRPSPPVQRRRRTIALGVGAAGLLLLVLIVGVASRRSGGRTTSVSPPTTAAPVAAPVAAADPPPTPGGATVAPVRPSVAPVTGATRRTTTTPPTRPPATTTTAVRVTTTPAPTTSPPTTAPAPLPSTPTTIAAATSPRPPTTG